MSQPISPKDLGAYYTPPEVVRALVSWATKGERGPVLDPSCGDGRFLVGLRNAVGVDIDPIAASEASRRVTHAKPTSAATGGRGSPSRTCARATRFSRSCPVEAPA